VEGLVGLAGPAHARPGTRARGAVRGELDHHGVRRHVVPHHGPWPGRGVHRAAVLRRVLAELLIQRMLVLQAAHQPPACPGDPQRVDGQVLVLRHPDRHRLEVLQERGAAQVTAARPDAALKPRLVPRPDLAQLDARLQPAAQVAHQRAEVHPLRRAEVDDERVLRADVVHRGELHGQLVVPDQPLRREPGLGATPPVPLVAGQVVGTGQAGTDRQPVDVVAHPLRRPHALGYLGPRVGGHEHLVADRWRVRARVEVVKPTVPLEAHRHHHAHRSRLRCAPRTGQP
jgi:hypothetical protein